MSDIAHILARIESGDPAAAVQLLPLVYDELRRLAAAKLAHEKPGQTLQATALVHEAYLGLVDQTSPQRWDNQPRLDEEGVFHVTRRIMDQDSPCSSSAEIPMATNLETGATIMHCAEETTFSRRRFVTTSATLGIVGALSGQLDSADSDPRNLQSADGDNADKRPFPQPEPIVLAAKRVVFFVIDMQRYFVHPDYTFGRAVEKDSPGSLAYYFDRVKNLVIPNCQRLQQAFRAAGASIVYTAFGSLREDGLDMPRWARGHNAWSYDLVGKPVYPCAKDPSWHIDESLAPAPNELVVAKTSSGPLNSTMLDQMFRTLSIDTLVVAGVVTDGCVTQAAREFADRDFKVLVVEDACATKKAARHEAALETFADYYGEVTTTDRVLSMLADANRSD